MAEAEIERRMPVEATRIFDAITRYEEYPQFVDGVSSVEVLNRNQQGTSQTTEVSYEISVMGKSIAYKLRHTEDRAKGEIGWTLLESNFFKSNSGRWVLESAGAGETDVRYEVNIEFSIPVPGFILKKLVKANLPGMLDSFEKRAREIG